MLKEELQKSIDAELDNLFKSENIIDAPAPVTADEVLAAVVVPSKDDKDKPKQISDVPQTDTDGSREGTYDSTITSPVAEVAPVEAATPAGPSILTKSEKEELEAFRAEKLMKAEILKKAEAQKAQDLLIKSAVLDATAALKAEVEALRKSFTEQSQLVKSFANTPAPAKSIARVEVIEKSMQPAPRKEFISKADKLNAAERLLKAGKISEDDIYELEMTGNIYNKASRNLIEEEINK